jgi:hypothetical protein
LALDGGECPASHPGRYGKERNLAPVGNPTLAIQPVAVAILTALSQLFSSNYIASNSMMINELETTRKEVVMT